MLVPHHIVAVIYGKKLSLGGSHVHVSVMIVTIS